MEGGRDVPGREDSLAEMQSPVWLTGPRKTRCVTSASECASTSSRIPSLCQDGTAGNLPTLKSGKGSAFVGVFLLPRLP